HYIYWNVNGTLYPAERYFRRFHRPDLVQKALRGERITAPAMSANDVPPAARFVRLKDGDPVRGNSARVTIEVQGLHTPKEVELRNTSATPRPGKLYVLAVGVSHYQHAAEQGFRNLNFPAADAQAIAARFQKEGKPLYEDVQVLPLTDREATAGRIRAELKR